MRKYISILLSVLITIGACSPVYGVSVKKVPKNNGKAYKTLNKNRPKFSKKLKAKEKYEKYKALDSKGRCTYCTVIVSKDTMPTGKRGSIGMIKPTGWHTVKYEEVGKGSAGYLYNRCHLIGWQLTGQNANKRNLITGTRYLNITGMLPFENKIANYVKSTGNRVLYRVKPYFLKNNLLASGVQMEALSLEDNGKGVKFNVYCYNKQPKIKINYRNGNSSVRGKKKAKKPSKSGSSKTVYITPTGKKYHRYSCSTISKAKKNRTLKKKTKSWCKANGYTACKVCKP